MRNSFLPQFKDVFTSIFQKRKPPNDLITRCHGATLPSGGQEGQCLNSLHLAAPIAAASDYSPLEDAKKVSLKLFCKSSLRAIPLAKGSGS